MKHTQHAIKFLYSAAALGLLGCSQAPQYNAAPTTTNSQPAASTGADDTQKTTTADATGNTDTQTAATPTPTPTPTPSATPAAPAAALAVTSPAFADNGAIPALYVAKNGGGNMSIPLQWKNIPAGTASFAVQMVDLSLTPPLVHWLITNIPATSTQLPAGIPAGNNLAAPAEAMGANQTKNYGGPNPPNLHRYELTVYAIKAGQTLNVTTNNSAANKTELESKSLGKAAIVGTYQ